MSNTVSELYSPLPQITANSYLNKGQYEELYRNSVTDPEGFWRTQAHEFLQWRTTWNSVLEFDYSQGLVSWFNGASLNVCENCVDRHLPEKAEQPAIIWEGNEPGESRVINYRELHELVSRYGNLLKEQGVRRGDRVVIYLPMIPEAAVAMLACARIGAVHSVVFAGFSAESLQGRINDCQAKLVITADEGLRGPKRIPLKATVDQALLGCSSVSRVLVVRRTGATISMQPGRDLFVDELLENVGSDCPPEVLDSEDPLFILYTSGSTGKPKGLVHTQAGYLLYAAYTHKYVFDYHSGDIHFCAADVGWITGHTYIVYGPLANGATTVMFESTPLYPDAGRYWDVVDRIQANIFYTAPTAIRSLIKEGDDFVKRHSRSSLRILGSVGEPINRDAWLWYYNIVGEGRCAVVDTWWQTETGGIMISPLPGATGVKPGSATLPLPGVQPIIVDESGKELTGNEVRGRLCIKFPWPGAARTVYGDHKRFIDTYFKSYPGLYFTGDACSRDSDGYYWISGRVDDVLLVSGHRLGTAEVESAVVRSGVVAEAAVVGMPHDIKGVGIYVFCVPNSKLTPEDEETARRVIIAAAREHIGALATPDVIQFVRGLPKTRSGKIMRRILRKIVEGERENFGDITTLAEPEVVAEIANGAQSVMQNR